MKSIIAVMALFALSACSNSWMQASQFQAEGTKGGLSAGTDPAAGGFSATLGYQHVRMTLNPNAVKNKEGEVGGILSSSYANGASSDSRSMYTWKNATVAAGGTSVAVGGGDGAAFGTAGAIRSCMDGGTTEGTLGAECMRALFGGN